MEAVDFEGAVIEEIAIMWTCPDAIQLLIGIDGEGQRLGAERNVQLTDHRVQDEREQ